MFSWPRYGRRGAYTHWNGSYHCGVFNSNRNRGHCIQKRPFVTRNCQNSVYHKVTLPDLEMLITWTMEHICLCLYIVIRTVFYKYMSNSYEHNCILISFWICWPTKHLKTSVSSTLSLVLYYLDRWYICIYPVTTVWWLMVVFTTSIRYIITPQE